MSDAARPARMLPGGEGLGAEFYERAATTGTLHLQRCDASDPVPSEREFFESYLRARYGRTPSRCC